MQSIQTSHLTIQYRQAGDGEIPLILLHGNYASSRWWLPLLEHLPEGVRAYAPDLRGCGNREGTTRLHEEQKTRLTIEDLADDLDEFITALALEKPIVVGHSLGGVVATEYAVQHPDRICGMVLEDTGPPGGLPSARISQPLFIPLELGSRVLMYRALRIAGIPNRGPLSRALVSDALAAQPGQYMAFTRSVADWNVVAALPDLDIPVLIVWGQHDRVMPPKISGQYADLLPQAEVRIFPDAGHSPHLECPHDFGDALQQFVERCRCHAPPVVVAMEEVVSPLERVMSKVNSFFKSS